MRKICSHPGLVIDPHVNCDICQLQNQGKVCTHLDTCIECDFVQHKQWLKIYQARKRRTNPGLRDIGTIPTPSQKPRSPPRHRSRSHSSAYSRAADAGTRAADEFFEDLSRPNRPRSRSASSDNSDDYVVNAHLQNMSKKAFHKMHKASAELSQLLGVIDPTRRKREHEAPEASERDKLVAKLAKLDATAKRKTVKAPRKQGRKTSRANEPHTSRTYSPSPRRRRRSPSPKRRVRSKSRSLTPPGFTRDKLVVKRGRARKRRSYSRSLSPSPVRRSKHRSKKLSPSPARSITPVRSSRSVSSDRSGASARSFRSFHSAQKPRKRSSSSRARQALAEVRELEALESDAGKSLEALAGHDFPSDDSDLDESRIKSIVNNDEMEKVIKVPFRIFLELISKCSEADLIQLEDNITKKSVILKSTEGTSDDKAYGLTTASGVKLALSLWQDDFRGKVKERQKDKDKKKHVKLGELFRSKVFKPSMRPYIPGDTNLPTECLQNPREDYVWLKANKTNTVQLSNADLAYLESITRDMFRVLNFVELQDQALNELLNRKEAHDIIQQLHNCGKQAHKDVLLIATQILGSFTQLKRDNFCERCPDIPLAQRELIRHPETLGMSDLVSEALLKKIDDDYRAKLEIQALSKQTQHRDGSKASTSYKRSEFKRSQPHSNR